MEQEFSDTEIWQEEYSDGLNGVFTVPPQKRRDGASKCTISGEKKNEPGLL